VADHNERFDEYIEDGSEAREFGAISGHPVGFANSGRFVFADESAEQIASA
jgi:hypothetical protein